jgi:hypothetical protein
MDEISGLKREVFYRLMDLAGRVFIVARDHEGVIIGNRGFLEEERERGITLVFNRRMNFTWDGSGLSATLVFGSTAEKCHIPSSAIVAVYSPELKVQLIVEGGAGPETGQTAQTGKAEPEDKPDDGPDDSPDDKKIIRVDFRKKGV